LQALRERGVAAHLVKLPLPASRSAGGAVFIRAQFERTAAGFTGLTEKKARPEDAGRDAAIAFAGFLESGGALDQHLSDQILLPAALLAAGKLGESSPAMTRFSAERITDHLKTHAQVIEAFLPARVVCASETDVLVVPAKMRSQDSSDPPPGAERS
jgi:RNA 3'-terminal phosphate cyclase (ATP)